ncbi:DUF7007 domain-containing protein [Roseibium sp.]|uniref:DUF7007 domain-containing protein n=1 Tax=Roseibium sp. TaxID=1936156 RepID=UPI003D1288C0
MTEDHPTEDNQEIAVQAIFEKTVEGHLCARVGDTAFAMLPTAGGAFYLALALYSKQPDRQLRRDDFFGHEGRVVDEVEFRSLIDERMVNQSELDVLGRRSVSSQMSTPWGSSQGSTVFGEGVTRHHTAGHGGFHLSHDWIIKVDSRLRNSRGWYEEDVEWAIVAITLPDLFTSLERREAERTTRDWLPDAWERISAETIAPGASYKKDQAAFHKTHANDWIVTSAITSQQNPGYVETIASRGGKYERDVEQRRFLIPSGEYSQGRFGFVVDTSRHETYDGPSSFIGWEN